jgi:acyl-[acyl-carrier-protein]-phospholipid O-acyltransferase/long-chain-fatty-acid--[acyl-carrier-protein] ligase
MLPPGLAVPVIPVRLGMIWGSIFTYYYGKIKLRFPAELPHPASVTIGKPVDPNLTGYQMRLLLSEMAAETELIPAGQELPLHSRFAQLAKHHPLRKMIKEFNGTEQREPRNFSLLVKAVLLSREIRRIVPVEDKYVGIMLPGTAACTVTVLAVMMADKTPAMINFTASREANASAIAQAGLHCILTSKLFLKKANLEPCPQMVYLEDMAAKFTMAVKLFWTAAAALLPWRELMNLVSPESNRDVHRTAVIIFSSGSTGIPKGVMLSHHNINSDLFSLIRIMNWRHSDKIIGNLPAFHGFGFTACLWLPIMYGAEVIYVPNPLDAVVVMQAIKNNQVTILLATPGFLQGYMRKGSATDFKSLRMVVCGAEKLRDDIADKFQNLTGLAIAEGYGCTELSPVVSVNIAGSILDLGTRVGKRGSIGAPMPGICVKIVDPETFVTLPADTDGLMLVKGATVMQGYLNAPEKTAEVIRDGWYITGDIAAMDSRGYITITGRLSRFSKVAGEMVPHELIEKEINQLLQSESRVIAVCGAPDAKKGEKLVVFYSDKTINPDSIVTALRQRQIPNLWIPRAENFIAIDNIPMLGSGKLDLNAIKLLAQKRFSNIP